MVAGLRDFKKGDGMTLVRWDPFPELEHMQSRLNRFFSDTPFQRTGDDGMSFSGWSPAVDLQETENEYLIKADLPDVKKEDVKVELLDGAVTIQGERQQEKEEEGEEVPQDRTRIREVPAPVRVTDRSGREQGAG